MTVGAAFATTSFRRQRPRQGRGADHRSRASRSYYEHISGCGQSDIGPTMTTTPTRQRSSVTSGRASWAPYRSPTTKQRAAEMTLQAQAEQAYRRLIADWSTTPPRGGAGATTGRASNRPSKGKAARPGRAAKPHHLPHRAPPPPASRPSPFRGGLRPALTPAPHHHEHHTGRSFRRKPERKPLTFHPHMHAPANAVRELSSEMASVRPVHDHTDAREADDDARQVVMVRLKTIECDGPQQRADNEHAAVGREDPSEFVARLLGSNQTV